MVGALTLSRLPGARLGASEGGSGFAGFRGFLGVLAGGGGFRGRLDAAELGGGFRAGFGHGPSVARLRTLGLTSIRTLG